MSADLIDAHFDRMSLVGLVRRGHPYDFAETYRVLSALYGYRAHYVNLGLWLEGAATQEAGRALALRVAEELTLERGDTLVDAGAGLGQAAVDLARAHELSSVVGINVSERQVAFARALARQEHLEQVITHVLGDAAAELARLPRASVHGVLALECIGHFPDPDAFLVAAHRALVPGRRLAFCLNVALAELTRFERALFRASYGFVPDSVDVWRRRLDDAGFRHVQVTDLTREVTGTSCDVLLERLDRGSAELRALPRTPRVVARLMLLATRRAVRGGRLGYALMSGAA